MLSPIIIPIQIIEEGKKKFSSKMKECFFCQERESTDIAGWYQNNEYVVYLYCDNEDCIKNINHILFTNEATFWKNFYYGTKIYYSRFQELPHKPQYISPCGKELLGGIGNNIFENFELSKCKETETHLKSVYTHLGDFETLCKMVKWHQIDTTHAIKNYMNCIECGVEVDEYDEGGYCEICESK